ncbi:hypothetical protein BD410DRAFT_642966 [Rickenella mellea]|uniref:Uncharacterized protein n=1 Tax=Rickenella mellea TaxID=50990 RepID=A0A4Y7PP72_9AGAM|nr:hypothetical protein BD410DRAFT_642966 [Rickenella mellea]
MNDSRDVIAIGGWARRFVVVHPSFLPSSVLLPSPSFDIPPCAIQLLLPRRRDQDPHISSRHSIPFPFVLRLLRGIDVGFVHPDTHTYRDRTTDGKFCHLRSSTTRHDTIPNRAPDSPKKPDDASVHGETQQLRPSGQDILGTALLTRLSGAFVTVKFRKRRRPGCGIKAELEGGDKYQEGRREMESINVHPHIRCDTPKRHFLRALRDP